MQPTSPRECEDLFVRCLNDGDLDALVDLYADDACHVREDGELAAGSDEVREVMGAFIAMEPELIVDSSVVVPGGDDVAVLHDRWRMVVPGPGGEAQEMEGEGMHVVRRQGDGSWRFVVTGLTNLLS